MQLNLFKREIVMTDITAKKKDSEASVTISYDLPESVQAAVERFGEDAVLNAVNDSFTIALQALIRRHIDKDPAEVQALADAWVPGQRGPAVKKTPAEKAAAALKSMTPEQRAELLASFGLA